MRKFKELGLKNKWLPKKNGKVYKYWLSILALIRRIRYKTKVTIAKSKYPKTLKWVLISAPAVIVLFVLGFIFIGRPNYNLSSEASLIVGNTNKRMLGELKYSSKTSSYVLNQTGINSAGSGVGSSRSIGGSESSGAYSASLPKDISKGITIYDDVSNLSFSMTPNMPLANAKRVDGHIVYPGKNGLQAVYTLLGNGLKEDLVLNHPSGNTASYSYTIKLPSYLQAKENGANAIGIYSADSALFGNISYGSSGSQQEVANARLKSPKTNLVFELLPPVVNQSNGKLDGTASEAKTTLKLKGNTIIVSVSGLAKLSYPVSIDPSVLVTSASFTTGNNEGDVNDTSGDLSEAGLDGGSVSAGWTTNSTTFTTTRGEPGGAVYNGYIYVAGGYGPSPSYPVLDDVQYAPINSNGSVGTWSTNSTTFTNARAQENLLAYNGYLYIVGGDYDGNDYNDVQYAPINANGSVGTWTATSSFTTARQTAGAVVYNGYMYIMGGDSFGTFLDDVQYAPINANGTLGTWNETTAFSGTVSGLDSVVYNGYLYVMGGYSGSGTDLNTVQYAPINANGTIGSWTTTNSFITGRDSFGAVAYNGYLYVFGGQNANTSTYYDDTEYASINSDGTIGAWTETTAFSSVRQGFAYAVYNGHLYVYGGSAGSTEYNNILYAPIDSAGVLSAWTSTSTPLYAPSWSSSAVYNGYVYQFGGYTTAYVSTVEYAPINSNGSLGTWVYANSMANPVELTGTVAYNGYMYVLGGKNSGGSAINNTYYALICTGSNSGTGGCSSTAGSLGTWTSATNYLTATDSIDAVAYNGYLYGIGGYNSSSSTAVVDYALICTGTNSGVGGCSSTAGSLGTWVATSSLLNATYFASSAVYNGYVYELGGYSTEVEYALICTGTNSGTDGCSSTAGSLGTWTNTTVLPASVNLASTEVWNGYMYEIISTGSSTSVEYDQINSNGSLGSSWTATNSSFPESAQGDVAAVYNGYIYELTAASGTSYYAQINNGGPGTIASWNTDSSNPLPQALYGSATAVYNGYIYILGGYNSSGPINYVYYAPISSAGVIGAWTSDTSLSTGAFTNARAGLGVAVYNGYLYIVGGGTSGGSVTYTSGSGNWIAPNGVTSVDVQAWGGGGGGSNWNFDDGGGGGGGEYAAEPTLAVTPGDSYSYAVGAGGSGTIPGGLSGIESTFAGNSVTVTANGGYGGVHATGEAGGTGSTNTIHYNGGTGGNGYASAADGGGGGGGSAGSGGAGGTGGNGTTSSGGTAGTAGATNGAAGGGGGYGSGVTGLNGQSPGGGGGGSGGNANGGNGATGQITITWPATDDNDIQYAALNSNGSLSAPSTCAGGLAAGNSVWCEATGFTTARVGLSTAVYNGNLYILGGQASSSTGGCTSTGDYCNDVQYDSINANGSLGGTWTDDTSLSSGAFSTARDYQSAVAYDGYLYVMGGTSVASQDLSYTGSSVNFTVPNGVTSLTVDMAGASGGTSGGQSSTAGLGGRIQGNISVTPGEVLNIYVGGAGGNSTNAGGSGGYGYGTGGGGGANGSTYTVGGAGGGGASAILYSTTPLSIAAGGGGSDGDEYDGGAGGGTSGLAGQSSPNSGGGGTQSAVGGGGTAGTCTSGCAAGSGGSGNNGGAGGKGGTPGLSAANGGGGGGGGYYGGGGGGGGSTSNGGAGGGGSSLVPSGDSTTAGYQSGNGYVNISYVTADNDVQYAAIASNGSLSEPSSCNALASGNSIWCTSTSLPTARQGLSAVTYNGYMYISGGQSSSSFADCTATSDYCNGVYYAPINNNGSIGAWTPTTSISTATAYAASTVYNGYVFYIGGNTSGGISSSVYYAGLDSIPRIGYYSILLDLSGSSSLDPSPTEILAFGSNTGDPGIGGLSGPGTGGVEVSYSLASNGCSTFTSPSTISTTTELNTAYPINYLVSNACSNGSTNFRYVWVRYALDDSQTASFPDVNGNHVTITGLSLYYAAAQADRLRGGATLTNGVQQPLYAPPVTGAP